MKKQKHTIIAGAIGNTLEWYDFTIYAFFVPLIAKQFFPSQDPIVSLLATFSVFAIGFLVRPVGAILFGYMGDRVGRKKALILSMIMMSFPTFFIGLLPNYETLGFLAPLLLTVLRIIQGLAVSGELTTATVFLIEHADPQRRGFAGSLAMAGALSGMVLSSIVATGISDVLTDTQLFQWGWRLPFIFGGLIGIGGFIIRLKTEEPQTYAQTLNTRQQYSQTFSVKKHFSSLNYKTLFAGFLLTSIMGLGNYFLVAYFNTFLIQNQGLPLRGVMLINAVAISIEIITALFMGRLSDTWGRKKVLGSGILGLGLVALPVFWLLTQHHLGLAFCGEILFALAAGTIAGLIPTTLAELFESYHRNMGISISYNAALALFGGTAPLVAMALITYTQYLLSPAYYIMICASIAFLALIYLCQRENDAVTYTANMPDPSTTGAP